MHARRTIDVHTHVEITLGVRLERLQRLQRRAPRVNNMLFVSAWEGRTRYCCQGFITGIEPSSSARRRLQKYLVRMVIAFYLPPGSHTSQYSSSALLSGQAKTMHAKSIEVCRMHTSINMERARKRGEEWATQFS